MEEEEKENNHWRVFRTRTTRQDTHRRDVEFEIKSCSVSFEERDTEFEKKKQKKNFYLKDISDG